MSHRLRSKITRIAKKYFRAFSVMSTRSKLVFFLVLAALIITGLIIGNDLSSDDYRLVPARGGVYQEGVVGSIETLNPLFTTSSAERAVTSLIYRDLFKYNKQGKIVGDLVDSFISNNNSKRYTLKLKEELFWSDGQSLSSRDIIKTIEVIKDKNYTGPLKGSFKDVAIEEIDSKTIRFNLENTDPLFAHQLTIPVMPASRIDGIPAERLSLDIISRKPVSSGPYLLDRVINRGSGITQLKFKPNSFYHDSKPYIESLIINSYLDYQAMKDAYRREEIDGMSYIQPKDLYQTDLKTGTNSRELSLPQLTAAFFNNNKKKFKNNLFKQALSLAVDKEIIVREILDGRAKVVDGPLGKQNKKDSYSYDPQRSEEIISSINQKSRKISLVTCEDPVRVETANFLKESWENVGLEVELRSLSSQDIGLVIQGKDRDYDILLSGYNLTATDNLFPFWHSSQREDGLNLANYKNQEVDYYLKQSLDSETKKVRRSNIVEAAEIVKKDRPATFLYSPYYLHIVGSRVKGVDEKSKIVTAKDRLNYIQNWYISEKRELKY